MRPVKYIHEKMKAMWDEDLDSKDVLTRLQSDEFKKQFEEQYKYRYYDEELGKLFYELRNYKKILEDTEFQCVYGEDASLQYYHQCQKCGNILHDPHDEGYVADHDLMCPTCNNLDIEKYPYKTIIRGTMHWIHLIRSAESTDEFNEKYPEHNGYVSGSAKSLAFRVTRRMALHWWAYVQWSRIKHIANIIRHPKKHFETIKKRNAWRKEMLEDK